MNKDFLVEAADALCIIKCLSERECYFLKGAVKALRSFYPTENIQGIRFNREDLPDFTKKGLHVLTFPDDTQAAFKLYHAFNQGDKPYCMIYSSKLPNLFLKVFSSENAGMTSLHSNYLRLSKKTYPTAHGAIWCYSHRREDESAIRYAFVPSSRNKTLTPSVSGDKVTKTDMFKL